VSLVGSGLGEQLDGEACVAGGVAALGTEARQIFGGWKEPKPYIRIVPQPG
jgi:hypothetical protein